MVRRHTRDVCAARNTRTGIRTTIAAQRSASKTRETHRVVRRPTRDVCAARNTHPHVSLVLAVFLVLAVVLVSFVPREPSPRVQHLRSHLHRRRHHARAQIRPPVLHPSRIARPITLRAYRHQRALRVGASRRHARDPDVSAVLRLLVASVVRAPSPSSSRDALCLRDPRQPARRARAGAPVDVPRARRDVEFHGLHRALHRALDRDADRDSRHARTGHAIDDDDDDDGRSRRSERATRRSRRRRRER